MAGALGTECEGPPAQGGEVSSSLDSEAAPNTEVSPWSRRDLLQETPLLQPKERRQGPRAQGEEEMAHSGLLSSVSFSGLW